MNQNMVLGVIQMKVSVNKDESLEKALRNIEYLAEKGANVIVLPEMFNCPYETVLFKDYAEKEGGRTYSLMQKSAKDNGVYLIAGTIPEIEGDKLYNTAFVFDPEGNLVGKHRKIHLFDIDIRNGQYFMESEVLTPGNQVTVIKTPFGKIGIAICYDVRFPELARLMGDQGAKLLVYPASFNMTTGPAHWELLLRSRALDQQAFVVGCAPARDYESGYISYGNSMIVNPWGEIIGRLQDEEGYLMGEIDMEELEEIRDQLPTIQHIRRDLYELKNLSVRPLTKID